MCPARTSKYNNIKTSHNGRVFDSKREAEHAKLLESMRKAKNPSQKVIQILYQSKFPIVIKEKKICDYVADFYVLFADDHCEIHEVKGFKTAVYKLKKKLVEAVYNQKIIEF